jgi:hypothetical protein
MKARVGSLQVVVAVLLVASAALFGTAASIERGQHEDNHVLATTSSDKSGESERHSDEHAEDAEAEATEESDEHEESVGAEETHAEEPEILGINPETPALIALAVALSVLLAMAVSFTRNSAVLAAVVAFCAVFAALDIREALHQLDENNTGIASAAIVLAIVHTGAAITATLMLARQHGKRSPA